MSEQIIFNGKTYASINDMPVKERKAYLALLRAFDDSNGNGVPDLFEGQDGGLQAAPAKVFFNGRMVNSLEELSPQEQAEYQRAMQQMDKDGNGIPDFVEGIFGMRGTQQRAPSALISREPQFPASSPVISSAPNVEPEGVNGRFIMLVVLLLGILGFGVLALFFLLSQ